MSQFDINTAQGFKALTLGNAAGIAQTLSNVGRNPTEWDIQEGSYNDVLFHVFVSKSPYQAALSQVRDVGGNRINKFVFPYRDGQTTDNLGRKPGSFEMEILIHGNQYLDGLAKLLKEFSDPVPGELLHPVRGAMTVAVEEVDITHTSDKRKAAALRVVFVEHNFTIGDIEESEDTSVKGALAVAVEVFAAIDAVIATILADVAFVLAIRQAIINALEEYKNLFNDVLGRLNQNFNNLGSTDIPGLLPVNQGGTGAVGSGANFPLAGTPVDESKRAATPALAAADMTKQVNQVRASLQSVLALMSSATGSGGAVGSLSFYDSIQSMKTSAILMQKVLETGIASSQAQVVDYVVPRVMSLREVTYINGLNVNRVNDVALLNPALLSINEIDKDTVVRVPIS